MSVPCHRGKNQQDNYVDLVEALLRPETDEERQKRALASRFLVERVFAGLANLNTGFDGASIVHVSPEDFCTVIDRCQNLQVAFFGIEAFSTDVEPPWKVAFLEVEISPGQGYEWARDMVRRYKGRLDVTICATYDVPDILLNSMEDARGSANEGRSPS
jgi:hypothetical protein